MVEGRSDRGGAWWGHAAGVGRAGVPGTWARRADSATGQWGGTTREAGSRPRGKGDAAGGRSGPGDQGSPGVPPTLKGPPWAHDPAGALRRLPGRRGCGERRAHTRAHNPREHAQCSPGNFLPSREPPRPPPGPLPARGWQTWGRGALQSPFRVPSALASPLPGSQGCSRRSPPRPRMGAWTLPPASRGQVRGRVARGLAVRPLDGGTGSRCARRAHRPGAVSRPGGRGCVSPGTFAHTLAVTHNAVVS